MIKKNKNNDFVLFFIWNINEVFMNGNDEFFHLLM